MTLPPEPSLLTPEFLVRLEQLELVSRRMFPGRLKGDRLSKRKGRGAEFADFRPYVIGDDLRFLDWNLFARVDRLFIRLFLEEEDLPVWLLIDQSLSMTQGTPTKFRYARQLAAALGFVGLMNLDRVTIETFSDRPKLATPPLRGRHSLPRMLKFLEEAQPEGTGNLNQSLREFSLRCPGRGIAVVLSDFLDKGGYEEGLRYLVARQLDVYAIQILSQEEIDPPFSGDLKLTDIEDGDVAEITVNAALIDRYRRTLAAFRATLHDFCSRRSIGYVFTSNQVPFEKLVLGYLRQRGLIR